MPQNTIHEIKVRQRTRCAVCQNGLPDPLIRLPRLPLTGIFIPAGEEVKNVCVDQAFHICPECGHGQVSNIVDSRYLYGREYSFRTSLSETSRAGTDVFLDFLKKVGGDTQYQCIVDIGCNDLFLLRSLKDRGRERAGIDPVLSGKENTDGIKVIPKMVEDVDFDTALESAPDLIVCRHTLEHLAEPRELLERLVGVSDEKALFVFEFPGIEALLEGSRFDRVFHQHLQYFSLDSLRHLLAEAGLELVDSFVNYHHWGALLVAFKKGSSARIPSKISPEEMTAMFRDGYAAFREQMRTVHDQVVRLKDQGVAGYGASNMVPVLFYHTGLGPEEIKVILDDDPNRSGLRFKDSGIPVRTADPEKDIKGKNILVTALDHVRAITARISPHQPRHIIVPLNTF